jgi:HD superfamily phosphohydrolase
MDHVKRDSVVCGLSLISFRLLELLGSMSVVLPNSNAYKEIHNMENKKPCILISEDGLLYVMDLLTARKSVFKDVLYSDENNWINGVVNQITALAVRYLPHLMNMLPFITDQVLMHFYTNDLFLGTQIEKLNKLFHGKMSYSGYGTPMRYKLNDGVIITNDDLKGMYEAVEAINIKPEYEMVEPAVVFYTNIKETRCPVCSERKLKKIVNKSVYYECVNCKSKIKEIDKKWEITIAKEENKEIYFVKNKDYDIEVILKEDNGNVVICEGEPKPKKEKWEDIFIYGKKFEKNYHPFQKLADKNYEEITIERFPDRPSESDVKNLLYVWINDFVISKKFRGEIKVAMGEVFTDKKQFDERFVNLNTLYWRGNQK